MYSELQREAAAAAAAAAAAPSSPWERARASFGFILLLPTWHAGESDDDNPTDVHHSTAAFRIK